MSFNLNVSKRESEPRSIRFTIDLANRINKYLEGTEASFSQFVIQACEYVMEEIENNEKDKDKEKNNN